MYTLQGDLESALAASRALRLSVMWQAELTAGWLEGSARGDSHRNAATTELLGLLSEATHQRAIALWTGAPCAEAVLEDLVPVAADEHRPAPRARGRIALWVVNVAGVDVPQSGGQRDPSRAAKGFPRRARNLEHLEVGMESGEVDRNIDAEIVRHPLRQLGHLLLGVVVTRNEERGDLRPDLRLVHQIFQGVEHRLQAGEGDPLVEVLGERLQVHIRRVHSGVELAAWLRVHVASGHCHRLQPALPTCVGHIHRVLGEDDRVVVGEGHASTAERERPVGDRLGRGLVLKPIELARLGDVPVLAEPAAQIAARGPEGEDAGAGIEVIQRLLFDRVDHEPRRAPVGGEDHPVAEALAHEAEAALTLVKTAVPRTEIALDPPVLERVPPPSRMRLLHPHLNARARRLLRTQTLRSPPPTPSLPRCHRSFAGRGPTTRGPSPRPTRAIR